MTTITLDGKPVHRNIPVPKGSNNPEVACCKCGARFRLRNGHVCCENCDDGARLPVGWQCGKCGRRNEG